MSNQHIAGETVRTLFAKETAVIDAAIKDTLEPRADLPMYGHLLYFMGFRDEALQSIDGFGGKRFRSSLALLLASYYNAHDAGLPVALALELFHNFTLIHDDIVDGDTHRRGRPTVWKLWGNDHAINSGDALVLVAYQVLTEAYCDGTLTDPGVQRFLSGQFARVLEGQFLDFEQTTAALGEATVSEAAYLAVIERKTADLIIAATKGAGLAAGASAADIEQLAIFGRELGVAYQICDDVVSIWGTSAQTGKRLHGDLLERKKTLPVLFAYETIPEPKRAELVALYNSPEALAPTDAEQVAKLLAAAGTYEAMRARIDEHAAAAKTAAANLALTTEQITTLSRIVDILLPDVQNL